jgi:hypothetical protein
VWGASAWIGTGWCEEGKEARIQAPNLGGATDTGGATPLYGKGIHAAGMRAPSRKLPAFGTHQAGEGGDTDRGRGVHGQGMRGPSQQLPNIGSMAPAGETRESGGGKGVHATGNRTRLFDIFQALSARLRHVRVACGDFERILTDAVTHRHGLTAVFLDPPYEGFEGVYGAAESVAGRARAWALQAGERADMRIALCGYEGEHAMPATWECVPWKAKGGYSNAAKEGNNGNARRERIWFSPACLRPGVNAGQLSLLGT